MSWVYDRFLGSGYFVGMARKLKHIRRVLAKDYNQVSSPFLMKHLREFIQTGLPPKPLKYTHPMTPGDANAAETHRIEIKRYNLSDVHKTARLFYGKSLVQVSSDPAEVWVRGNPRVDAFNKYLMKKFKDYPGQPPGAIELRKQGDITILSVGVKNPYDKRQDKG